MKAWHWLFLVLFSASGAVLSGCEQGPAERAGEKVDEAADEVGDEMEDAGDNVEDTID
ncbi:MAG: hypothetical protein ACT4O3_07995 [Elusimicrobiota bacterium]|jgi:hypothetical protein